MVSFSLNSLKEEITSVGFQIAGVVTATEFGITLPLWLSSIPVLRQILISANVRAIKKE